MVAYDPAILLYLSVWRIGIRVIMFASVADVASGNSQNRKDIW